MIEKPSVASRIERLQKIQLQTSGYGSALPIVYGTARIPGFLIWYSDFRATQTDLGFDYSAAVIMALCEGPIVAILMTWKDKSRTPTIASFGLTAIFGNRTQSPWSFLTAHHPSEAIGYAGTALIANAAIPLTSGASLENYSFEVKGFDVIGSGNPDAHPADVIPDLLTDVFYGAGWDPARIGDLSTGASSYRTYCTAAGFFISPVIAEQKPALEHLKALLEATNSEAVWSQGVLKIIPCGDVPITGNGTTYTPNTTPIYDLTVDDFITSSEDEDPISTDRASQDDMFNSCPVEFKDRAQEYNPSVVEDPEPVDVEEFGLRKESVVSLHAITRADHALQIARIRAQRRIYERNTYRFRLGWKYILLEPMDLVTLTEPVFGLDHVVVRIVKIEENDQGDLTVTATDWPFGVATATLYTPQPGPTDATNAEVDPGNVNTPVIFDAPELLTNGSPAIMLATSGGAEWGGCNVWISFDGSTYRKLGSINGKARHGVLTASLATGPSNDTTHTLAVDLAVSGGTLDSVSAQDKDDLETLCWVDGELLAFQTATLVSGNAYNLTTLRRGTHGSPIGSHASTTKFVRIDGAVAKIALNASRLGSVLYVKLQSFNRYGGGLQDLAGLSAHTFTPSAANMAPPYPSAVSLSISTTTPTPAPGQRRTRTKDDEGGVTRDGGGNVIVKRTAYVTVAWTFTNPYPASLLYKFRVVLYTGTDPNEQSEYWIPPELVDPAATSLVIGLTTQQSTSTLRAAVQAVYLGSLESSWRTSTGSVTADPDTIPVGTTSDYAEDGSGNPTAGAQLLPDQAIPLKVGPGGLQIGQYVLDEPVLRSMGALCRDATYDRLWYGGNCDNTVRGGAPDIARLSITRREWSTSANRTQLELLLQPSGATDNLDAMRYAKVELFRQSAAGTTATITALGTKYVPLPDRVFYDPSTDSDSDNAAIVTATLFDSGISSGFPACKVTLYNAFGPSDTHCFYAAAGNADGSVLTDNGTSWPAGITGGTGGSPGGGGGGGGQCVAPDTPVMLASGVHRAAGELRVGDLVWTLPELGDEWGSYPVTSIQEAEAEAARVTTTDGRELIASKAHRLRSSGFWIEAQRLQPGDSIDGLPSGVVDTVEDAGNRAVLRITVEGAQTYLSNRLLSHNTKRLLP